MTLFTNIKESAEGRELSTRWYRDRVRALGEVKAHRVIIEGKEDATAQVRPTFGMLNLFFYEPESAKRLPYYDIFPIVLPLGKTKKGFKGINFHYLSVPMRIKLLEILAGGLGDDTSGTIGASYSKVKRFSYVAPTLRQYKAKQVGSLFLKIPLEDMLVGLMLPVQVFYKGRWAAKSLVSPDKVWADSRRKINYGT